MPTKWWAFIFVTSKGEKSNQIVNSIAIVQENMNRLNLS